MCRQFQIHQLEIVLLGLRMLSKVLYLQRKCMKRYLTASESPDPHTSRQNTPFLLILQAWWVYALIGQLDQDLNFCFNALLLFMTFKGRPSKCVQVTMTFLLTFQNGQSNNPSHLTMFNDVHHFCFCSYISPLLVIFCPDFEGRPSKDSFLQARLNNTSYLVSLELTESFIFKVLIVFFCFVLF